MGRVCNTRRSPPSITYLQHVDPALARGKPSGLPLPFGRSRLRLAVSLRSASPGRVVACLSPSGTGRARQGARTARSALCSPCRRLRHLRPKQASRATSDEERQPVRGAEASVSGEHQEERRRASLGSQVPGLLFHQLAIEPAGSGPLEDDPTLQTAGQGTDLPHTRTQSETGHRRAQPLLARMVAVLRPRRVGQPPASVSALASATPARGGLETVEEPAHTSA